MSIPLREGEIAWTPELEAARLDLCHFMLDHADDPHTLTVHVDLGRRMKEVEQALTILGDIANTRSTPPSRPQGEEGLQPDDLVALKELANSVFINGAANVYHAKHSERGLLLLRILTAISNQGKPSS